MGRRFLLVAACSGLSPSLPALCGSLTSQSACRDGATDACVPAHRRSAPTAATAPAPSAHHRHGPTTPTGGRPTPVAVVTPRGCERAHPPQRVARTRRRGSRPPLLAAAVAPPGAPAVRLPPSMHTGKTGDAEPQSAAAMGEAARALVPALTAHLPLLRSRLLCSGGKTPQPMARSRRAGNSG